MGAALSKYQAQHNCSAGQLTGGPEEKALHDPELIAEAKKGRVEVKFSRGEELEALVRKVMEQPREVIARIR